MGNSKDIDRNTEVKDETLDVVSGGGSFRGTTKMVPCKMPGCGNMTTNPSGYCTNCQEKLIKEGRPPML